MLEDFARKLETGLLTLLSHADLSKREQDVLHARWLHPGEPTLLTDVAKERKVTRERIRQTELKAFRKIRDQARGGSMLDDLGKQADQLQHELDELKSRMSLLEALRYGRKPEAVRPPSSAGMEGHHDD